MPNKFNIEYFEPKYLKKADKLLAMHLEVQLKINQKYKKELLPSNNLWEKIKTLLHIH